MPAKRAKWNLVFQKTIPVSIPWWDIPAMLLHGWPSRLLMLTLNNEAPKLSPHNPTLIRTTSGSLSSPKKKFARKRLRMTKVKVKTLIGSVVTVAFL